eukprot:Gb_15057 [translate_table: standard]
MVHIVGWEAELNVPPRKMWKAFEDAGNLFPKLIPSHFKSIEVLEGDGISAGTVRLIKYGKDVSAATFKKEKIEFVDEENMVTTHSVVDGEIMNTYKLYKLTLKISQGSRPNSCIVRWTIEFEPAKEGEMPHPENAKDTAIHTFKVLEGYLLTTPS